jgi:hypothetical protein
MHRVSDDFGRLIAHCGAIFQPRPAIMPLGTIIVFRDDGEHPRSELVLSGGDRVQLALDGEGLTVTHVDAPHDPTILFQADSEAVAHICAGLVSPSNTLKATPLRILVSAIVQLGSASEVRAAFKHAAAQVL